MGNNLSNQPQTGSEFPPPNFVFFSCHFPFCHRLTAQALKNAGVRVLGVGDESYDLLHPDLKAALTEYYRIPNLGDYDQLHRAMGYFIHKYGRIQFFESFIEHWQETEARVRTDFNIAGYDEKIMAQYKRKSGMKVVYRDAGLPIAPGMLPKNIEEAKEFANKVGYPLIMKPDMGVGAIGAKKINDEAELSMFWEDDYFIEKFIYGEIETFDGLADENGKIVFYSSMLYAPIMEVLTGETPDSSFYVRKDVPQDLVEVGFKTIKAFNVKSRFFHAEFFRTREGNLLCLEINLRPPGAGNAIDMMNYGHRTDVYKEYANVITRKQATQWTPAKYYTAYCGRRGDRRYVHTQAEVKAMLGKRLECECTIPTVFRAVMGDNAFIFTCDSIDEMNDINKYILVQQK